MAMWTHLHLLSMWRHVAPGSQALSFLLLLLLLFLLASATEGALEAEALSFSLKQATEGVLRAHAALKHGFGCLLCKATDSEPKSHERQTPKALRQSPRLWWQGLRRHGSMVVSITTSSSHVLRSHLAAQKEVVQPLLQSSGDLPRSHF